MAHEKHNLTIKDLTIQSEEAFIIDAAFKSTDGDVFKDHRELLSQVARCIAFGQEVTLGVTEQELWELRARINPNFSMGRTTGADLLYRIYSLILEYRNEAIINDLAFDNPVRVLNEEELEEIQNEIIEIARYDTEVKHARERENEDYTENDS